MLGSIIGVMKGDIRKIGYGFGYIYYNKIPIYPMF